ncbi:MAG: N-acetylmuramoyl-L-alanine amidase [Frankiales bacterium]|nr:N-acetylmuramoyl-L-alanine amidase [Frankiales bacterium]
MPLPTPSRRLVLLLTVPLLAGAGAVALPSSAATPTAHAGPLAVPAYSSFDALDTGAPVQLRALSTRADLVTGGDVLVEVVVPKGTDVRGVKVLAGTRDVTGSFRKAGPGLRGLVTRLPGGKSTLKATVPGVGSATLPVTNVLLQAPSFSGPLIQPWTCNNGATRADCSKNATITYVYKSTDPSKAGVPGRVASDPVQTSFQPYDPAAPADDVATTTTDEGKTVPFIVRVEEGYSLRDQYRIAALFDPATQGRTPSPTAANPGYADKLVLAHGTSCDTSYESGTATDVLFEEALAQGFAVASHALDNAGHNCNIVTQAESLVRTKEMVVERFGPLRYTIGSGCSGGSLVQQQIANAYPGVYQGITPQCSFTDAWSSAQQYVDYVGLRRFLEGPGAVESRIVPAQWPSIFGHANPANQITFTEAIPNSGDPSRDCPGVASEKVFTTASQKGVRCSFQDYMKNVFGLDAKGKAHRPISNVGVQYGLSGLLTYLGANVGDATRPALTPDQFVALNAGVGGFDIDFEPTAARTQADPVAQDRVYRSGAVNTGAHLDKVAIIDLGGPEPGAFHDVYRKFAMRDRLVREHGTSANQVFWQGQTPLLGDPRFAESAITAMDTWLAKVEADRTTAPLARKIIAAKGPAGIGERCVGTEGLDAPLELCRAAVGATLFSSPRIEAGGGDGALVNGVGPKTVGFTDDRLDCQTLPIETFVYAGKPFAEVFDAAQQATLRKTFPTGVCDYSKPGTGFQKATTWQRYQDGTGGVVHGGVAMGTAPRSTFRR